MKYVYGGIIIFWFLCWLAIEFIPPRPVYKIGPNHTIVKVRKK